MPQNSCRFSLLTLNEQTFIGPWTQLAAALGFGHGDAACLRATALPTTVTPADSDFTGVTPAGLVFLCAKLGHLADLLLLPVERTDHVDFLRAFRRSLLQPTAPPGHPLLKTLRVVIVNSQTMWVEVDLFALFGLSRIDHAADLYAGLAPPPSGQTHRAIYDIHAQSLVATASNSSKNRLWVLSAAAARLCMDLLLARRWTSMHWICMQSLCRF